METNRTAVLAGLLAVLLVLTYITLAAVVYVLVFAVTVAYVLFPLRENLRERGLSRRLASAIVTLTAFLAIAIIAVPVAYSLYRRREMLLDLLTDLPETVEFDLAGQRYALDIAVVQQAVTDVVEPIAVDAIVGAPALALGALLFTIALYGMLYRPRAPATVIYGAVPPDYHDIIDRLHERTQRVLYALYVIQAVTAVATFFIALTLFYLLGYPVPIWLALFAAILQFIPMLGPTILIVTLAVVDIVVLGNPTRGIAVFVLGSLFVALLPDAAIRPKLARLTGEFSQTLYFVGFVGGLVTLGAIGIIVGPLAIALLVETVEILDEEQNAAPQD